MNTTQSSAILYFSNERFKHNKNIDEIELNAQTDKSTNMKLKFKILLCYFIFSVFLGYGQQDTTEIQTEALEAAPIDLAVTFEMSTLSTSLENPVGSVIPSSPNASSLMRYLDYPVSNATGIPDINIPLYVINSGELSLPISLSYHSSGRRVYDRTGAVGLGWTLNAGGMISRTIYGDADGWNYDGATFPDPWKKSDNVQLDTDFPFLASIDNRDFNNGIHYDTEYDIFSYTVNSLAGKFIIKGANNNKEPVLIPKNSCDLRIGYSGTNDLLDYFELIDENGITYRFGRSIDDSISYKEISENCTTGWMLTDIVSANKEDTIHFKYESFRNVLCTHSTVYKKSTLYYCTPTYLADGDDYTHCPQLPVTDIINPEEVDASSIHYAQRIKEISFRSGKIIFHHELEDQCSPPYWLGGIMDNNIRITGMDILDYDDNIIKKIDFVQSEMNTFSDVHFLAVKKLDAIVFKDQSLSAVETYSFDYYPVKYNVSDDNRMNVRYLDFWGYYNASGKVDMCPFIPVSDPLNNSIVGNVNADRSSDLNALKSGVLKKIIYPTGGYSEFFYEENQYDDQGTTKSGGGLRIYQIKQVEGNGDEILKTYKYGNNECGYGDMPLIPGYTKMMTTYENWLLKVNKLQGIVTAPTYKKKETVLYSNILPELSYVANLPVFYTSVTEYQGDDNNNNGKIVYTYSQGNTCPLSSMPMAPAKFELWKKSNLLRADIYSQTGNPSNPYKLVKSTINSYKETKYASEIINGLWLKRIYFITPPASYYQPLTPGDPDGNVYCTQPIENNPYLCPDGTCSCIGDFYFAVNEGIPSYFCYDYTIEVGKNELTGVTEKIYTDAGEVENVALYEYNSNHLLKEKQVFNSSGDSIEFIYRYPPDINSGIYAIMAGSTVNMLNFPIEQTKKVAGKWTDGILTTYKTDDGNIVPDKTYTLETTVPLNSFTEYTGSSMDSNYGDNPEMEFIDYDTNGNLIKAKGRDGIYTYYLWAYNKQYPVAKIVSSNSGINISPIQTSVDNITFSNSDVLANIQQDINSLNTALTSVINSSENQVSYYTYKPLVGITSETDPAGRTIYYEYDDFGRLSLIRDQNDNIVEKYEYNYASQ